MFNKSNFCHIASNNRNEQKGSVFIYKTADTLAQVTQSGYFNEKMIDINLHDLIIHVQYDPVARTLKKSVLIVTERTMDNVETTPILDQTIGDDIDQLGDQVAGIEEKIPDAASAANQLADKAFVNAIKNAIESTIEEINTSISTLNNDLSQTNQNLSQTNQNLSQTNQAVDSLQETKQDIATAVNYDNITNCITNIPQDIKLELNNGTLTLKAGSKVYVPNGVGNFDELVIQNDLTTINTWGQQTQLGLFVKSDGSTMFSINMLERVSSGSTPPTATNAQIWYDTTNNLVKQYEGGSDTGNRYSLPIALVQKGNAVESSNISSIDQVFNGFGYIGSTVFALPGVKGLIPNGRNEDGSLKSIETETTSVQTYTYGNPSNLIYAGITSSGTIALNGQRNYNEAENFIYVGVNLALVCEFAKYIQPSGKITSFTPKTAFYAVDYNNSEYIAHQAMPSDRYVGLTVGAHGASYTAPADGYFSLIYSGDVVTNLGLMSSTTGATSVTKTDGQGGRYGVYISVSKGESVQAFHYGVSSGLNLRFIYANGSK